jgi:hypothetical protein
MRITIAVIQSQPHVWADVAYQAVLSLGPALITAGVSWLAFRSQLKLKDKEIDAQAKLKAKKLMFNSYQGLLERREKDAVDVGKALGQLSMAFRLDADEEAQLKKHAWLLWRPSEGLSRRCTV